MSPPGTLIRRTHSAETNGTEFILSDETPDRFGDVIASDGWNLDNFQKNPIALFNHKSDFPIGKWADLHVADRSLRGRLELAPPGTSDRIDEIRRLVDAGILRAVSVGFVPRDSRPRDDDGGGHLFTKQELLETSLVSIPANPNAISVAKSLHVSDDTLRLVFGEHAETRQADQRRFSGEHAKPLAIRKAQPMSLAQRIKDAEKRLVDTRDELGKHLENSADDNVSDADLETRQTLNSEIIRIERTLDSLREAEKNLGQQSDDGGRNVPAVVTQARTTTTVAGNTARPFSLGVKKQLSPIDLIVRAGVVQYLAHVERKPVDQVRKAVYGDDDPTRAVLEYAMKAASAPAMTTVTGWAAELVQTLFAAIMETLHPKTVYPRLSARGLSMTFGRAGKISIPTRSLTPSIAGSFVGEGQPIPVRQGAFTTQILVPKKMAIITTWTREIDEYSVPAIEALLRDGIQEDTGTTLDSILLDVNPATAIRPAGILNGIAPLTPTPLGTGTKFDALVGDIKQISGALLTATKGNVRMPCWLMNPQQVMTAGLTSAPGVGAFPFQSQIDSGNLQGWPIIDSGTVPLGRIIALDAADFVSVGGDAPRFELSDQATLHMEDTAPTDITTTGTPPVAAFPVKSMFQTDSIALRLILPINWTIRRPGVVAWVDGVTW